MTGTLTGPRPALRARLGPGNVRSPSATGVGDRGPNGTDHLSRNYTSARMPPKQLQNTTVVPIGYPARPTNRHTPRAPGPRAPPRARRRARQDPRLAKPALAKTIGGDGRFAPAAARARGRGGPRGCGGLHGVVHWTHSGGWRPTHTPGRVRLGVHLSSQGPDSGHHVTWGSPGGTFQKSVALRSTFTGPSRVLRNP